MKALAVALAVLVACGDDPPPRPKTAITIVTAYPGASSEVVESTIVQPLEAAVASVNGVTGIEARIDGGNAVITLIVARGRDSYVMSTAVQAAVQGMLPALPPGTYPSVQSISLAPPALVLAVDSQRPRIETSELVDENVRMKLERLVGVGRIELRGFVQPAVIVRADPQRLTAVGLSPGELVSALNAQNLDLPGGRIDAQAHSIRVGGNVGSIAELEDMIIGQAGSVPVRLRDVAQTQLDIEREPEERELRLEIHAQAGASRLEVRERVREELRKLALPPDVKLREIEPPSRDSVKVRVGSIVGPEYAELTRQAEIVLLDLGSQGIKDVVRDPPIDDKPELRVDIDRQRADLLGVDTREVMSAIEIASGGVHAGELVEGTRHRTIIVRLPEAPSPVEMLQRTVVRSRRGDLMTLGDLVKLTHAQRVPIFRRDRERAVDLLAPEASAAKIRAYLEKRASTWPAGYRAVIAR